MRTFILVKLDHLRPDVLVFSIAAGWRLDATVLTLVLGGRLQAPWAKAVYLKRGVTKSDC